ncbi:MAG: ABC transporter ATP-binding protein, partial [Lachnospiraceae bacterium]|nr:ABC transporter ATP-binding protein [Lachnospiraceae bacterium]
MEKKISTGEAVKRVMREIGEFRTPSVLTPIMMIGEVVVETLIPLLMASIIDNGINKGDMKHILLVGGGMLILALTGLFFGVMGGVYGAKASTGFARNLRRAMFTNIETFSFSNIDRFSTSGLVTRLTTDVTNVQ